MGKDERRNLQGKDCWEVHMQSYNVAYLQQHHLDQHWSFHGSNSYRECPLMLVHKFRYCSFRCNPLLSTYWWAIRTANLIYSVKLVKLISYIYFISTHITFKPLQALRFLMQIWCKIRNTEANRIKQIANRIAAVIRAKTISTTLWSFALWQ